MRDFFFFKRKEYLKKKQFIESKIASRQLPEINNVALVSVIILTRDGLSHIKRLLPKLKANTVYSNVELIIVDNDSKDKTEEWVSQFNSNFKITYIKNDFNESFSCANNKGRKSASGEYIVLLNNDVEPLSGWLVNLLFVLEKETKIGAVGSRLIYPGKAGFDNSFKIQHSGIRFNEEKGLVRPCNFGKGEDWDSPIVTNNLRVPCVTAACLLVRSSDYDKVGGLTESYNYGYEDVDFCLKLQKEGLDNFYCADSVAFHYEFGTQNIDSEEIKDKRRHSNIIVFKSIWDDFLLKEMNKEKVSFSKPFWAEGKIKVVFTVTSDDPNTTAGDFFTALELSKELENLGAEVCFLSREKGNWYDVPNDTDVLISMLDNYDLTKISTNANPLKLAWARNWFERWGEKPWVLEYDVILSSSKKSCSYLAKKLNREIKYFPIATNPDSFRLSDEEKYSHKYVSDYCFTGSKWGIERSVEKYLEPSLMPYKFKLFGANWERVNKFKDNYEGFIKYSDLKYVYNNTKLLIDDANHVTKEWGAVNSRVFDALGLGVLVISNGKEGSIEFFDGKLPYYESKDELNKKVTLFLADKKLREEKVTELKEFILRFHTYEKRAKDLIGIIRDAERCERIGVLVPAPNLTVANEWGDYHLGNALKKYFEKKGVSCRVFLLNEWNCLDLLDYKNVLVLRGLSRYETKPFQNSMMWLISHPDKVTVDEMNTYNEVFVASHKHAEYLRGKVDSKISILLQCTDPELFYPDKEDSLYKEVLMIGNSRNQLRDSIKKLLPTKFDLSVYGTRWRNLIPSKYIKGDYIENNKLNQYYSSAGVLLNDHWEDMKEKGFISNRVFDALACEANLITDEVEGLDQVFGSRVHSYSDRKTLVRLIGEILKDEDSHRLEKKNLRKEVVENHAYSNRVEQIMKSLV